MCGIAGLIHKNKKGADVGSQMSSMLQALKHRGPDSTGFAVYSDGQKDNHYVVRLKVAEQADLEKGFDIHQIVKDRTEAAKGRLEQSGAKIVAEENPTEYAGRYTINYDGDMKVLADYLEDLEGVEVLSIGRSLELIKDLGDAEVVSETYGLKSFKGTHAIGHTRMATESDVDIRSAHPYWAYPFSDISVVHNGQLTNYWTNRRDLERRGHRFSSNCDSELIAVYLADRIEKGDDLESAMKSSVEYLDGVFTYIVATKDMLGMAKDTMAAKPMVLFESDDLIAMASEEISIRQIFDHDVDTFDPYDGEVKVWKN
jgi:glutamate synthase domain-containing protein 1